MIALGQSFARAAASASAPLRALVEAEPSAWAGVMSVLDPAGADAARIESLWWLFFWTCAAVWILVVAAALWAAAHRPSGRRQRITLDDLDPGVDRRMGTAVAAAVGITAVILSVFLVTSFLSGRALAQRDETAPFGVRVIGRQWWWEVRYEDPDPSRIVVAANEIHVPVGVPVLIKGESADVIHSFWVPSLNGKRDLIPGRQTEVRIIARRAGTYRGQCAEFCGAQHAHMALVVIAQPRAEFDAWLEAQRRNAAEPASATARRGREVFLSQCHICHTVRGTTAASRVGPDLTHLASRRTLAAGTLPNVRGALGGWVLNPQAIKPGAQMPPSSLPAEDFQALLDYLQSLV